MIHRLLLSVTALAMMPAAPASAAPLGSDAAACEAGRPSILANVVGLKDRRGIVKLELYPATQADFTRNDHDLIAEGKTFRRVTVTPPASGPVSLCLRVPGPGRYALLFTHNREGHNKFNYKIDGAALPANRKIGYARPKVDVAIVDVGTGVLTLTMRVQYFSLFGGFSPSSSN